MISKGILQCAFVSGWLLGGAAICVAQGEAPTIQDRPQEGGPSTSDRVNDERRVRQEPLAERTVVKERVIEQSGEVYVGGFGGWTRGHEFSDVEGTGTLKGQGLGTRGLANSVVYGAKLGYFHPGRLNWLGLEVEGFNTTPHIKESSGLPGSHLRVTTLAFNVIARTTIGCGPSDRDNRDDLRGSASSLLNDHVRCPLHAYAGAGPGIFFAETSNQFGRSTDNGRVGLNALAGLKYFMNRHIAVFAEYKFNYARFDFNQAQGQTAGLAGNYLASHVIGGFAWHF